MSFNSLAPGRLELSFGSVIFKLNLSIDAKRITFEIALMWLTLDLTGHKSRLVQVMVSCRQATSQAVTWAKDMAKTTDITSQSSTTTHETWAFILVCIISAYWVSVHQAIKESSNDT